mmetsp:Transcript_4101/g.7257  ORF Transcript_4101/g.7257 Transcript_4101/m.7257 type:complete len:231 (-) Transcript_4101:111-803(-)
MPLRSLGGVVVVQASRVACGAAGPVVSEGDAGLRPLCMAGVCSSRLSSLLPLRLAVLWCWSQGGVSLPPSRRYGVAPPWGPTRCGSVEHRCIVLLTLAPRWWYRAGVRAVARCRCCAVAVLWPCAGAGAALMLCCVTALVLCSGAGVVLWPCAGAVLSHCAGGPVLLLCCGPVLVLVLVLRCAGVMSVLCQCSAGVVLAPCSAGTVLVLCWCWCCASALLALCALCWCRA